MKSPSCLEWKEAAKKAIAGAAMALSLSSCGASTQCDSSLLARQFQKYSIAAENPGTDGASRSIRELFGAAGSQGSRCHIPELGLPIEVDAKTWGEISEARTLLYLGSRGDSIKAAGKLSNLLFHGNAKTRHLAANILYEYALNSALYKAENRPVIDLGSLTRAKAATILGQGARKSYYESFMPESEEKRKALRNAYDEIEGLAKIF